MNIILMKIAGMIGMFLLLGLVILLHEIGHFCAFKAFGVRVTRFGFGMPFGPTLKLFKWGYTTFYLHACLFGGYVSCADDEEQYKKEKESNKDKNKKDDIQDYELLPSDSTELYENKNFIQKFIILSAGVFMNIVCAIVFVIFCASIFHKLPTIYQKIYVNSFSDEITSNIQSQGIKSGDRIIKINDSDILNIYQLKLYTKNSKLFDGYYDNDLYEHNLKKLLILNPNIKDKNTSINNIKINLPELAQEKPLKLNSKMLMGLEKYIPDGNKLSEEQTILRDEIFAKSSIKLSKEATLNDIAIALSDTYKPMTVVVLRNDKEIILKDIKIYEKGLFGVNLKLEEIFTKTEGVKDITIKSFEYVKEQTDIIFISLWQLITKKVSINDMHGVVAVVKVGGDIIAYKGIMEGIIFTAIISLNLAVMNLLPIPALDGGQIMFLIIQKITGRKPNKEIENKINMFFFTLLMILLVYILYNDIFAIVTGKL